MRRGRPTKHIKARSITYTTDSGVRRYRLDDKGKLLFEDGKIKFEFEEKSLPVTEAPNLRGSDGYIAVLPPQIPEAPAFENEYQGFLFNQDPSFNNYSLDSPQVQIDPPGLDFDHYDGEFSRMGENSPTSGPGNEWSIFNEDTLPDF